MKTIPINLSPEDGLRVLKILEESGEDGLQLQPGTEGQADSRRIDIYSQGVDTVHSITLRADGTWVLTSHLEV